MCDDCNNPNVPSHWERPDEEQQEQHIVQEEAEAIIKTNNLFKK